MIKGIIFDKDGTMFDTERFYFEGWKLFSEKIGKPLNQSQIMELEMLSRDQQAQRAKELLGDIDPVAFKKQISQYVWDKQHQQLPMKKGLMELLEYAKKNHIKMSIASSGRLSLIQDNLRMVDLEDYFCALVSGHDVQRGKPFPDVYLEACSQMGLSPNECLVIEDSPSGLMGGFQAGCQTIYIPDLFELSQQERKNVSYCCDSLLDVIEIIKKKDR